MAAASCAWPEVIRRIGVANIAHRGASAHAPENTIVAFERAFEMCAHAIELDVRLTGDGVPIVIHDEELSRTTDGSGRVGARTLREIRDLDAGSWFSPEFAGARVPTLEEALQTLPEDGLVNVEIKGGETEHPGLAERVLEIVDTPEIGPRTVISSYDIETIRQLSARSDVCGTSLRVRSLPGGELDRDSLIGVCMCVNLELDAATPGIVDQLHDAGFVVEVYTVNDRPRMEHLIALGVDAIFTDRPDTLADVLAETGS